MALAAGNRIGSVYIHLGVTSDMATFRRAGDEAARVSNRMRNTIVAGNRQISDSFTRAGQAVAVMHGPLGGVASRLQALSALSRGASLGMASFAAAMAASTFGMAKFVQTGDKMQRMSNNLRTVTTGSANLAEVQTELFEISQRSRVAMEGTVTLYARMARSTESLGLSQQKLLRITETVQKSFAVGGATTQEAMGAAIQLSQGIASDRFSGDEFRSVAENAPVLLREMAKQLGVNIGKLREMAHAGALTGKVVTEAIYGASEAIDRDFGKTISTFEQGMARLWNSVDMYVHGVDKSYGVTQTLASGVNALADSFEDLMWWVESAAIGLAAFAGGRIAGAALKSGKGYLGDVAVHGLFARTRMQTKKELDEITRALKDIDKARAEIEKQIRDQEQRFVDRASRSSNAVAMIKAAHQQEADSHEKLAALERGRSHLQEQRAALQRRIVEGLKAERLEAQRLLHVRADSVSAAGQRYATTGRRGDLRTYEREQAKLAREQEKFARATERLRAAQDGVYDAAAVRAYGNELNSIQKQLNANLIAQHKTQQDIAKAQQAYVDAQKRSPEEAKKLKVVADQHRVTMAALVSQQDKLSGEYNTLISKQTELNGRVSLMGAAMARVSGFVGSMLALVGGAPGLALMGIIGSFTAIGSSLANSTRRTEEFRQKLIELGITSEEVAEKIGGTADKTLANLIEWQKTIDDQIAKLQGRGTIIDRMFGSDSTASILTEINTELNGLRNNAYALERAGMSAADRLAKIANLEAFSEIVKEVEASSGSVADLDHRLDAIVQQEPRLSKMAVTIRGIAQALRDAATASEMNARDMAVPESPAWLQDQMWQSQQLEMLEKRREAISLILDEHRATYDLTRAEEEREKVKKDLIKAYEEFAKNNKDIVEGITSEQIATEANISAIIHEMEVRKLLNDAMGRQEKRARDMTDSLVEAAMDGKIGLNDMKAAMEQLAAMNPDLSSWITEIMKVAAAAVEAQRELSGWTMDESKGGRVRVGSVNLPDKAPIPELLPSDFTREDWANGNDRTRESYERLIESAQRRNDQMRQEIELVGKSSIEAEALRYEFDLLVRAKELGYEEGSKELQQVRELAAEYRRYAEALGLAEAMHDIMSERDLFGLSEGDRDIAKTVQSYGFDINSTQGQIIAGQLRVNQVWRESQEELKSMHEIGKDAFMSILDLLYETGDIGENLIGIFAGIGKQFAKMGMERLWKSLSGEGDSIFGGGSSGGNLASIGSLANAGFSPVQTAQIGREIGAAAAPSMSASIDTGMESFMAAIRKVESGSYGGDYGALGPVISNPKSRYFGDRAYGAYQVMGGNIEQWTREVLGTSMSIKDFLSSQAAQDKVAYAKLGQSIDKFGTFSDAASVWFSGGPLSKSANRSDGYNSVQQYVGKVNSAMDAYPGGTRAAIRDGTVDAAKRIQTFGGQAESFDTGTGAPGVFGGGNMKDMMGVGAAAMGAFAGGFQSGNPLMGGLSGAMSGFGAAPMIASAFPALGAMAMPLGIIGGAVLGFIGGLLGRAKQKREELKKAQQELESQIGAITQLIASATGNFMGQFEKSITETSDEFAKAIQMAQKAKNQTLVNELKAAQDEFFKETTERWVRGFEGMLASMQAGLGFDGAFSSGMDAVEKMRESLVGFVNDARMFAEANGDLAGYMAARNKAYGIGVSNTPLNEYSATRSAHGGEVNLDNEFIDGYVELGKQAVKSGIEAFNRDGGQFYDTVAELRQAIDQAGYELDELGLLVKKAVDPVGDFAESVERARLAAIDTALAMLSGAREFTEMEEAVQKLEGAAAGLPTLLGDLGMAAEEAASAIADHLLIAMQKMRLSVETDLVRSIADLSDLGYLNDLFDTLANMQTRIRDAYAAGADMRLVFTELSLRLRQIAGDAELSAETLAKLAEVFPEFAGQLMELAGMGTGSSLSSAKAALDQAKADLRVAYEAEKSTIEQLISRHQSLIKSLRQFLDDLRLDSNLSPLDPYQRLQEAQRQFQETAALALTGDEEALGKLESVSRSYLEEARAYYATSEAYFSIFTEVESILDQALSVADRQLSEAEQQLAALDAQIGQLIDIADNTKSIADAIADLAVAEAAYAAAVDARFAEMAALMQMQRDQQRQQADYYVSPEVLKLYQDIQGRFPEREGAEYWQKIFGSGLDMAEVYRRFIHDSLYLGYTPNPSAVAQYGVGNVGSSGLPMFSTGGFTGFGGIGQVAGVVHGQEFVAHAEATRRWRPQLEAMNAGTYRGGGQDNAALIAEIKALREQVASLEQSNAQVTVAAAQEQVAATEGTTQAVNRQADGAWRKSKARAA